VVLVAALIFRSVLEVACAMMVTRSIYAATSLVAVCRQRQVLFSSPEPALPVWCVLRDAWPYAIDALLSTFLGQIDIVMLDRLAPRSTVGIYGAGSRIVQMLLIIPAIVANVVVPSISRSLGTDKYGSQARQLFAALSGISLAGALGLVILGPPAIGRLLGHSYEPLNGLWLAFGLLVLSRFYEAHFGILMIAVGRMKKRVLMQVLALAGIVSAASLLVPRFGAVGMIDSIAATYCLIGLFYCTHLLKERQQVGAPGLGAVGVGLVILSAVVTDVMLRVVSGSDFGGLRR